MATENSNAIQMSGTHTIPVSGSLGLSDPSYLQVRLDENTQDILADLRIEYTRFKYVLGEIDGREAAKYLRDAGIEESLEAADLIGRWESDKKQLYKHILKELMEMTKGEQDAQKIKSTL